MRYYRVAALFVVFALPLHAAELFARFKVLSPAEGQVRIAVGAIRHEDPWVLPAKSIDAQAGQWSDWLDASGWKLHGRLNRAGAISEWPTMTVSVSKAKSKPITGCSIEVELADHPDEKSVVQHFTEKSESAEIAFLLPLPLRQHAKEFETGSQITARQLSWAKAATNDQPVKLKDFTFITALWGHYDPGLARQAIETLKLLGFNIIGNYDAKVLAAAGIGTYGVSWNYSPNPADEDKAWGKAEKNAAKAAVKPTHYVIGDEIQTMNFVGADPSVINPAFREYLRARGVHDGDLPKPIDQIEYPAKAMNEKSLPRNAALATRRLLYHAAKFGQYWSVRELRHSADLIRETLPGVKIETLPADHAFFDAWGPPHIGMSYRVLDLFEIGKQRAVDQLSAEDWLGLNHMYGPQYTWTGAQSVEYFNAICRSAMAEAPENQPMMLRDLLTVSDDNYLRLKAYSALGQGSKSFFFWTFGPTYIGTENYWSDLRSEYDGIAKLGRAIQATEDVLYPAKPISDPVAILYSVSQDIWHTDDPAAFVEKRLTWHALRHLHVQPDFLREEAIEAGRLDRYKVLYINDWCISRAASEKIDAWVKAGGVVYLSAGAATRDEYCEPYVPPFAATAWPADAGMKMQTQSHRYNERTDLPKIKPMTTAKVTIDSKEFELPVLGVRCPMSESQHDIAHFADGSVAGSIHNYGKGNVIAVGFMPMLAYGQGAHFKPDTLAEVWPAEPRELIQIPLTAADITPVADCDTPVVETSLLSGEHGSALILVNYTYKNLDSITIEVKSSQRIKEATSNDGKKIQMTPTPQGVRLTLPLEWTDIVVLK